jgi:hypothetical protein
MYSVTGLCPCECYLPLEDANGVAVEESLSALTATVGMSQIQKMRDAPCGTPGGFLISVPVCRGCAKNKIGDFITWWSR